MNQEQKVISALDKILHTLTNIETKTGRILKQIEKMQNESKNVDMKKFEDDGK